MKKLKGIVPAILCAALILSACGADKKEDMAADSMFEQVDKVEEKQSDVSTESNVATESNVIAENNVITEEQALTAVQNYCETTIPGFNAEGNAEGYTEYWDVSTNENGEIVVLYRSYTAAQARYYINPETGETYVTELVPGIIDEEQKTGETFNIKDYLVAGTAQEKPVKADEDSSIPVEYETADGILGSFLLASDRDKIDTANDYGVLYSVVYETSLEGDELIACGSMHYKNFREQDPISVSSDVKHVFKVDDNTVYQKIGESGTENLSKEEFAEELQRLKETGIFFEVEVSNGVVVTALLSI